MAEKSQHPQTVQRYIITFQLTEADSLASAIVTALIPVKAVGTPIKHAGVGVLVASTLNPHDLQHYLDAVVAKERPLKEGEWVRAQPITPTILTRLRANMPKSTASKF